jgi:hypothetical protein
VDNAVMPRELFRFDTSASVADFSPIDDRVMGGRSASRLRHTILLATRQVSSARPKARRAAPRPSSGARCSQRSQRSGASFSIGEKAASTPGREQGTDMASIVQRAGA